MPARIAPESLAKLGILSNDFERITCCWLDGQNASEESCEASVSKVNAYPCLRELRLINCRLSDVALARLGELPRLCVLELPNTDLSDSAWTKLQSFRASRRWRSVATA